MKSESENNFYPFYKVISINNNINPSVDILIESIDRFSFGEDFDDDKLIQLANGEIKKQPPNNYGFIKSENFLSESNQKMEDLNNIINNIFEIKIINEENKNKGKICGIFNKEDFELKIDKKKKHKNNQLNDSFEKNYSNPLKNILDDEDDNFPEIDKINNNKKNNNKDLPISKNEDSKREKEKEKEREKEKEEEEKINNNKEENIEQEIIINDITNEIDNDKNGNENQKEIKNENELNKENNNINLNGSNSNMKINNYDADDDKENEQKIKEIKEINNSDTEIPIGDLLPFNNKQNESKSEISKEIPKLNIDKDNNQKNKDINLPIKRIELMDDKANNNIFNDNDDLESPRLGSNFVEEEKEEKDFKDKEEKIEKVETIDKEKNNTIRNSEDNLKNEKENEIINGSLNKINEQQMNLPLSLNIDSPFINPNIAIYSSKNDLNNAINQAEINNKKKLNLNEEEEINGNGKYKDNKDKIENKDNKINNKKEKDLNMNLAELKENSFIIKNTSSKPKIDKDSEEKNKKILELTQKLEKTEKDAQKIKETNEKLLEVINMFKNWQTIEQKKPPNSGKNSRSDTPKRHVIKKRCFTPTLSKTNKFYKKIQVPAPHHKRSNSYNKIRINNHINENKLYIDYMPPKQKTYRELHGRESNKRKEKKNLKMPNNIAKSYGNYINRNTIYLTGTNNSKYLKSPYLNNNMNYTGISYSNGFNNFNNHNNSYNNYLYMNNSSQSFYVNKHNMNNNLDDNFKNIYQRQVMQMPPNEQPLFYETKSNLNMNNSIYNELIYNNNINYNSENKYNRNNNINEKNNKYIQEMPFNFNNNSHDISSNNNPKKINNSKRSKNKLLDFKDFQIIFDEPLAKEKNDNNHLKKNINNSDNKIKSNENSNLNKINNNKSVNNNIYKDNDNKNFSNNNYNLINYREYSNYKMNELNKNNILKKNIKENLEDKKNKEKYEKVKDDNNQNDKNAYNNGITNNIKKKSNQKMSNNKNKSNNINNINNNNSKEFNRNKYRNERNGNKFNNLQNNESNELEIPKDNMNLKEEKTMEKIINKNKGDYILPFYLINRNEMFFNILSYTTNEKTKKKNK